MANNDFYFRKTKPEEPISSFVESFWMLENRFETEKEWVILPDGRIDIVLMKPADQPFKIDLLGIETQPKTALLQNKFTMFVISFRLLAADYIFKNSLANVLDSAQSLPSNFWNFEETDLEDFDLFCSKATQIIQSLLPDSIDTRKQKLFDLIYTRNGEITIHELSERVGWSSRQMNRYFNLRFGLSVKAYCDILRFRSTFQQIKNGDLFPDSNFFDQSHFIKQVKKLSGSIPKILKEKKNDRFIQLSTIPKK